MIRRLLRKYKFLHHIGFHNEDCRRRLFTTRGDYICLRTGNTHKNLYYEFKTNIKKK